MGFTSRGPSPVLEECEERAAKRLKLTSPLEDESSNVVVLQAETAENSTKLVPECISGDAAPLQPSENVENAPYPDFELRYTLFGHKKSLSSVKFSPDGKWLVAASGDVPIHIYSLPTFSLLRTLNSHQSGVSDVAFSADSAFLASASDDRTVRIWEVDGGPGLISDSDGVIEASSRILRGHLSAVFCVAWNPRGDLVASGGMDETVRIWDIQKGTCMRVLPAHSEPVSGVQFNRDGTTIVSCSWDGYMRIWDTATGQCLKTLVDDDNTPVSHVCFSPNSRYLFASTLDSTIRLWDFQSDKTLKTYSGNLNRKYCIPSALLHGGTYLVTGSEDHKITIWDIQSREIIRQLTGQKDVVISVACHPTKAIIASGGLEKDPTVKIWVATTQLDNEDLKASHIDQQVVYNQTNN